MKRMSMAALAAVFAFETLAGAGEKPLKETGGLRYENPVWKLDAPDPTVWQAGDRYYASSTHHDVLESRDLVNWRATGGKLLEEDELKWIRKTWPNVWAPDVVKMGEWYNLYICYHNGGAHTAIAVYRSKEPQGPFKDRRILLKSEDDRQHEVIDPEVVRDEKGRVWMFFGHGDIRRVELTEDGLARKPGSRIEHVAGVEWNVRGEKNKYYGPECATEGAYLHRRGDKWYLFVSQGGWNDASYQVAVGRADSLDGRFFDRQDRPMVLGHATKILGSEKGDDFFGPGHNGEIFTTPSGRTYMFYHCHWTKSPDRKPGSWYVPRPLFLQEVLWDKDGWPYFGNGGKPQGSCVFK